MVDYICLAMIGFVKEYRTPYPLPFLISLVMNKKSSALCLQRLLKFPPVESIATILALAQQYRSIILQYENECKKVKY